VHTDDVELYIETGVPVVVGGLKKIGAEPKYAVVHVGVVKSSGNFMYVNLSVPPGIYSNTLPAAPANAARV
jgi:hypothetical protein